MEYLHNGFALHIPDGTFPLSTDSIALADFVRLGRNARVLDLGAGCGTLGLLLCARDAGCSVAGIELDPVAHEAALANAQRNAIESRLTSICADLTNLATFLPSGEFDVCVSNPPYFSAGPHSRTVPNARREDQCSMDALFKSAAWALRYGGDFFLIHRPERLAELFACAAANSLEPKRLRLLRHKEKSPVTLVLVQCRKGARPGLIWEEASLYDSTGQPTEYYRQLYHLREET